MTWRDRQERFAVHASREAVNLLLTPGVTDELLTYAAEDFSSRIGGHLGPAAL